MVAARKQQRDMIRVSIIYFKKMIIEILRISAFNFFQITFYKFTLPIKMVKARRVQLFHRIQITI